MVVLLRQFAFCGLELHLLGKFQTLQLRLDTFDFFPQLAELTCDSVLLSDGQPKLEDLHVINRQMNGN